MLLKMDFLKKLDRHLITDITFDLEGEAGNI